MAETTDIKRQLNELMEDGPLPVGKPMRLVKPTPQEKARLEALGWDGKTAVPNRVMEIAQRMIQDEMSDQDYVESQVGVDFKMKMPATVDISDLPPAKQAELRRAMREMFQAAEEQYQQEQNISHLSPSVEAAVAAAESPVVNIPAAESTAAQPEAKPAESSKVEGYCARCGFDKASDDPIVISDHDKSMFLQTIWGAPFLKQYTMYGGKMKLIFRTLTPLEVDMIYQQVSREQMVGAIMTDFDRMEMLFRYRMILQLVSLESPGMTRDMPRSIDAWEKMLPVKLPEELDEKKQYTLLWRVWRYFANNVTKTESSQRVLYNVVREFNGLVTKLEAQALNVNFS